MMGVGMCGTGRVALGDGTTQSAKAKNRLFSPDRPPAATVHAPTDDTAESSQEIEQSSA